MHSFAIHPDRPGDDPIFALNKAATDRLARGESIVNATIGVLLSEDGTLTVLPTAARTVSEIGFGEDSWAPYAPISGEPGFLQAVRHDLLGRWPELEQRAVAVATPGGSGAIRHAVCNFLEQGQALLTSSFYWSPYAIIANEHGRRVETFAMFGKTRADALDLDALNEALTRQIASQRRALVVINDPCHNPTGYSMTEAEWTRLADLLASHAHKGPVSVLVDAAYCSYASSGVERSMSALSAVSDRVLVLVAWSASKTFTHYGLRVGSLVAVAPNAVERDRLRAALGYASRATWSNCNRGGMLAIARLLADQERSQAVKKDRQAAVDMLNARVAAFCEAADRAHLPYPRYDGGFFVTVFAQDAEEVARRTQDRGVFVVPFQGGVRIALCAVPICDVPRVVDALAAALAQSHG